VVVKAFRQSGTRRVAQSRRRGAAAAEFALLLFPLTVLLLGTIDFCRAFYAYNTINNCARNAAMWAALQNHSGDRYFASLTAAAQADAGNLSPAPTVGASDPVSGTDADGNATYTVTVSHDFTLLSSYLFGSTTIPISRSVTMRVIPSAPN
jgi:Flp pilus assembly protein TadG